MLSYLAGAAPHGLGARSMSAPTPSAAAPSVSASATDRNAPGRLEAGEAGDAVSRDDGHLPADEALPSHENGQEGDAALGDDEDATKQVIANSKTCIRTPYEQRFTRCDSTRFCSCSPRVAGLSGVSAPVGRGHAS